MFRVLSLLSFAAATFVSLLSATSAAAQEGSTRYEAVISVADQRLVVLKDGMMVTKYPVSTSKYGTGDAFGSYRTPLGKLRVCDKIGAHLASGSVLKRRQATGEVLRVNAPGRDPVVTRILWLDGMEGQNANAKGRSIYIHGTPEESQIGRPVSFGCIRMRSSDVLQLFETLQVGSPVTIVAGKLPRYQRWEPSREIIVAQKTPAAPTIAAAMSNSTATEAQERANAAAKLANVRPEPKAEAPRVAARTEAPSKIQRSATAVFSHQPLFAGGSSRSSSGDVTHTLKQSMLYSGVEEAGNSEMPRLRR